ncbi:hypothetical protein Aduo_013968 [Ancylostoma duodenale]
MLILSLLCIVGVVTANSECIWAVGRLVCNKDQKRVLNSVVEIRAIDAIDPDDKAGLTVVDEENGVFKVEGMRIILRLEEITVFPPKMKVFAPNTMDHFLDNPIVLDRP